MDCILAYDLGTGGIKASLFNLNGESIANAFEKQKTYFPYNSFREQKPDDWWTGLVEATKTLLNKFTTTKVNVVSIGISGHSLGVVAIDKDGELLSKTTPIWSDARAKDESQSYFKNVDYKNWYYETGNGFPPHLYSIFKIMWYKNHNPELYNNTYKFIGTKDYINFLLTGVIKTDFSYASGSGVYSLNNQEYNNDLIKAAYINEEKLPDIVDSHQIIGELTHSAASQLNLPQGIPVVCGGVDNACMALGAGCYKSGDMYASLGTSAWITISSDEPILDFHTKPYVFAHCVKNKYIPSTAIFSSGSSHNWVLDNIFTFLNKEKDSYKEFDMLACKSPVGANKLIFNPSLAGGSSIDYSPDIKGCFTGLDLVHTKEDIARATLEGIAFNLKIAKDILVSSKEIGNSLLVVGGGSKSTLLRQIFADIFNMDIIKSNIDQDAASLGAASLAAFGAGYWKNYDRVKLAHNNLVKSNPDKINVEKYEKLLPVFEKVRQMQSEIGEMLGKIEIGGNHE